KETDFALRDRSLPAPRTGATVKQPFPPAEASGAAPEVATGPPEVLRHSPDGDVPVAPQVSVTFPQPMIPVTSHEEACKTVPLKLTPQPQGQWRWIGTKTLLFDPPERLPMATRYTAEVPAGTKSETGGTLAKAAAW